MVLLAVIITLLLINQLGQPYLRGFFCDDTSIAYPYKDNTVSAATVFAAGSIVPIGAVSSLLQNPRHYLLRSASIFACGLFALPVK